MPQMVGHGQTGAKSPLLPSRHRPDPRPTDAETDGIITQLRAAGLLTIGFDARSRKLTCHMEHPWIAMSISSSWVPSSTSGSDQSVPSFEVQISVEPGGRGRRRGRGRPHLDPADVPPGWASDFIADATIWTSPDGREWRPGVTLSTGVYWPDWDLAHSGVLPSQARRPKALRR